jgi:multisubunit Na+/H+ antiporter MnhB subunit
MSNFHNVLIIIGILALLKGVIILLFPEGILKISHYFTKSKQKLRNAALIEVMLAIVLFLIAILVK